MKDLMAIDGTLHYQDYCGMLARAMSLTEEKQNYIRSAVFLVKRTTLGFIGVYSGRGTIGLKSKNDCWDADAL